MRDVHHQNLGVLLRSRIVIGLAGIITVFSLLTGCGYKFAEFSGNRLNSNQLLWVSFIANDTISASAQTVLRRALLNEAHTMRGIAPSGSAESADLLVSGAVRSYGSAVVSYTAADRAREFRLTIDVEMEMKRKGESTPVWKGKLQAFQDFPGNDDLTLQRNAEEAALAAASRKLAQKFLIAVEQSY